MIAAARNQGTSRSYPRAVHLRERVAEACHLVESRPTVRGVHIVAKGQPTDDELRQFYDYAEKCNVDLTVDAHGMISIRPGTSEGKS